MHQGRNGRPLARPPDALRNPFCESYAPLRSCDGIMRLCAVVFRSLFRVCSHPTSSARAIKRHQSEPSVRQFSEQASGTHVAFWGNGDFGRLGLGHSRSIDLPEICSPHSGLNPRQVACGGAHSLVLSGNSKPMHSRYRRDAPILFIDTRLRIKNYLPCSFSFSS